MYPCIVSHLFCIFCRLSLMHRWTDNHVRLNSTKAASEQKKKKSAEETQTPPPQEPGEVGCWEPVKLSGNLGGHAAVHNKPMEKALSQSEHPTVQGLDASQSRASHAHQISSVQSQHALARRRVIAVTAGKTEKRQKDRERERGWISAMSPL